MLVEPNLAHIYDIISHSNMIPLLCAPILPRNLNFPQVLHEHVLWSMQSDKLINFNPIASPSNTHPPFSPKHYSTKLFWDTNFPKSQFARRYKGIKNLSTYYRHEFLKATIQLKTCSPYCLTIHPHGETVTIYLLIYKTLPEVPVALAVGNKRTLSDGQPGWQFTLLFARAPFHIGK